jgi:hypothetical protein
VASDRFVLTVTIKAAVNRMESINTMVGAGALSMKKDR